MQIGCEGLAPVTTVHELSLAVVGINYLNPDGSNRRFEIATLGRGDPVELRPEPRNRHDRHAIGVFSASGTRIGYLPAERAPWVGAKMLDGLEVQAVFQEVETSAAFIRLRLGGGAPTLPIERPHRPAATDFYPDEDGPEWGA